MALERFLSFTLLLLLFHLLPLSFWRKREKERRRGRSGEVAGGRSCWQANTKDLWREQGKKWIDRLSSFFLSFRKLANSRKRAAHQRRYFTFDWERGKRQKEKEEADGFDHREERVLTSKRSISHGRRSTGRKQRRRKNETFFFRSLQRSAKNRQGALENVWEFLFLLKVKDENRNKTKRRFAGLILRREKKNLCV